ncbi:hypothetical protein ACJW30_01G004200 [Castanea mollissima]
MIVLTLILMIVDLTVRVSRRARIGAERNRLGFQRSSVTQQNIPKLVLQPSHGDPNCRVQTTFIAVAAFVVDGGGR